MEYNLRLNQTETLHNRVSQKLKPYKDIVALHLDSNLGTTYALLCSKYKKKKVFLETETKPHDLNILLEKSPQTKVKEKKNSLKGTKLEYSLKSFTHLSYT